MELTLGIGTIVLASGSYVIGDAFSLPSKQSILLLDRADVNRFDRGATYNTSKSARYISDITDYAALSLPLFHLISKNSRRDFGKIVIMSAETMLASTALTLLFKNSIHRPRPLMYNPNVPIESKWKKDNYRSFFSGHTAQTAAMSFFFAQTFSDYHPRSKWKPVIWSACAALPVLTGVMRYEAGKHYWTDVITGYAVGALVGVGIPYLHRVGMKKKKEKLDSAILK
ncbi:MAG: phosphatase PAP2 family protein [Bacteroidetes bacterium]|nr:phosphatase PAP2 family protein [Bacteroidota bacterium]